MGDAHEPFLDVNIPGRILGILTLSRMFGAQTPADADVLDELYATRGDPDGAADVRRGGRAVGRPASFHKPVFAVTHERWAPMAMKRGTTYPFLSTGIADALEQANAAAGSKNVAIFGGARIAQAYIRRDSSMRYKFTSCPCCSCLASAYSTTWAKGCSSSRGSG
jgi:hypothetical protein